MGQTRSAWIQSLIRKRDKYKEALKETTEIVDKLRKEKESKNKLLQIMNTCKCSITLSINDYRDYDQPVKQAIEELEGQEINETIKKIMIEKHTIISLQFYPSIPIGFYIIYHYDLEKCFDLALEVINGKN